MLRTGLNAWAVLALLLLSTVACAQSRNFIPVEGASLQAKFDAAVRQARAASPQTRFWTAYSFDVRPGVAVDLEYIGDGGNIVLNGSFEGNVHIEDGFVIALGSEVQTRNLGVFLLQEPARGGVSRIEIFNLERRREYSRLPVYWLGRAGNEESLGFLRHLVDGSEASEVSREATRAIALHDDRSTPEVLESIVRTSRVERVRAQALYWLAHLPSTPARQSYLLELARNEAESLEVRGRAINAYGRARDAATLNALVGLYANLSDTDLRKRVLAAAAQSEAHAEAAGFLLRVAASGTEELSRKALAYLGELAGERTLGATREQARSTDAETEIQKEAVSAIGRRPKDEAVPLLINVARTHRKPAVRWQAFRMLGGTGDARALAFFREVLSK